MNTVTTIFDRKDVVLAKKAAHKFNGRLQPTAAMDRLFMEFNTKNPFSDGQECKKKFKALQSNITRTNIIRLGNE